MATENNIYEKYSDEELRLMLAIGLKDDNEKAATSFMHFVKNFRISSRKQKKHRSS